MLTHRRPRPAAVDPDVERAVVELAGWDLLLAAGRLAVVSGPIPDPGNPAGLLVLVDDRTGRLGPVRVLLAINATPEPDGRRRLVALYVPHQIADALAAAAWTYDDDTHPIRVTPALYATTARRT